MASLRSKSVISEEEQQAALNPASIQKTRALNLLTVVQHKISHQPQVFVEFVRIVESESSSRKLADNLVDSYLVASGIQTGQFLCM